jgi:hypothetical protein
VYVLWNTEIPVLNASVPEVGKYGPEGFRYKQFSFTVILAQIAEHGTGFQNVHKGNTADAQYRTPRVCESSDRVSNISKLTKFTESCQ